jgi:hypothetical protein
MKNYQDPIKMVHKIKKENTSVTKSKDSTVTKYPKKVSGNKVSQLTKTTKNYSKKIEPNRT